MGIKHKETIHERIDRSSGEQTITTHIQTFKSASEPSFVKMYIDDIAKLNDLGRTSQRLLFALVKRIGYDSWIHVNKKTNREIAIEIGIKSVQTIYNELRKLVNADVLRKEDGSRGSYMLNPEYFAKGEWKNIRQLRKDYKLILKITYDKDGRKVETDFQKDVHTDENGDQYIVSNDGDRIDLA